MNSPRSPDSPDSPDSSHPQPSLPKKESIDDDMEELVRWRSIMYVEPEHQDKTDK